MAFMFDAQTTRTPFGHAEENVRFWTHSNVCFQHHKNQNIFLLFFFAIFFVVAIVSFINRTQCCHWMHNEFCGVFLPPNFFNRLSSSKSYSKKWFFFVVRELLGRLVFFHFPPEGIKRERCVFILQQKTPFCTVDLIVGKKNKWPKVFSSQRNICTQHSIALFNWKSTSLGRLEAYGIWRAHTANYQTTYQRDRRSLLVSIQSAASNDITTRNTFNRINSGYKSV